MITFYSIRSNLINDIIKRATGRTLRSDEIAENFSEIKCSLAPYINYCVVTLDEVGDKLKISEETYDKKELNIKIKVFDKKIKMPVIRFLQESPEIVDKGVFKNLCKEYNFKDYREANEAYDSYVEIYKRINNLYNDGNYDVVIVKTT